MKKSINNEKNYYNKDLEEIIKQYITKEQYGNFAIILEEIFQRRAYEFNFSNEHIAEELSYFCNNIKKIEFASNLKVGKTSRIMGVYIPAECCIRINQDYFNELKKTASIQDFGERIFQTLTHECYHAIEYRHPYQGLSYYDPIEDEWKGTALDEIFVETAADRASTSRTSEDAQKYRRNTNGYPNLTFLTNMLSASIGTTEKELLRAGIQNRDELMTVFYSQFPDTIIEKQESHDILENIESCLDVVYNISYYSGEGKTAIQIEMDKELIEESLINLYKNIFCLAEMQIANIETEVSLKDISHLVYRYKKLDKIMQDSLSEFEWYGDIEHGVAKRIISKTEIIKTKMMNQIVGLEILAKQGYKIKDSERIKEFTNIAKKGDLLEYIPLLKEYGIEVENIVDSNISDRTLDMTISNYVMKEDFDNGKTWDNESVVIVLDRIFTNYMKENGLYDTKQTEELVIVENPKKVSESPMIDDELSTVELPVINKLIEQKALQKNKLNIIKEFVNKFTNPFRNIITKFKNRNSTKLDFGENGKYTKTDYYTNLAINKIKQGRKEVKIQNNLDKYKEDVSSQILQIENLKAGTNKSQNKGEDDTSR